MISEKVTLREVFTQIDDDDDLTRGIVSELRVNTTERAFSMQVTFDKLISAERIQNYRKKVMDYYRLKDCDMNVAFSLPEVGEKEMMGIIKNAVDKFSSENPLAGAVLTDAHYAVTDATLTVTLKHGNLDLLLSENAGKILKAYINRRLKSPLEIAFVQNAGEGPRKRPELPKISLSSPPQKKSAPKKENAGLIFGKNFADKQCVPVSEIKDSGETCTIAGKIFSIASKEIKRKSDGSKLFIITFNLTDYTSSISCKLFAGAKEAEALENDLKRAGGVMVRGKAEHDNFKNELSFSARSILRHALPTVEDNAPQKRVELHAHTKMSSMDSVVEVKALIKRAVECGHKAVAITDHGVVQAFPDALKAQREAGADIKILYGVEGYLLDDRYQYNDKSAKTNHIIILAKNLTGLFNLYKLISLSHINYFYKRPRIPRRELIARREGLILGSACEQGELFRAVLEKKSAEEIREIASFYDYLEIQPIGNNAFYLREGVVKDEEELKDLNRRIVAIGEELDIPVAATCDVHFLHPRDEIFRRVLMAGQGFSDADIQPPLYFRTTGEMLAEFDYLDEKKAYEVVVETPCKIADMIEDISPISPKKCPPEIEGSAETIERTARENAKKLYGLPLPQIVEDRLAREIKAVIGHGYAVMYNIARLLVEKSLEDGYTVGSRGSVGSSFLAYLSNITEVNSLPPHYRCPVCHYSEFPTDGGYGCGYDLPDKPCPKCGEPLAKDGHDIPFETFLGFKGDKQPDIDLNFSGEYQSRAHRYTEEIFGSDNVFKAGTISTLAEKTAFGFAKGYFDDRGVSLSGAELERIKQNCMNVKKTTGQHPGGMIVLPKGLDINEFTPVQHPADSRDSDIITTHFDYHSIESNLLKLDLLGHDAPTMIKILEDLTHVRPQDIPMDDPKVMSLFLDTSALGVTPEDIGSETGTFAIPEFGTKFVRQMLAETRPTTFAELVRISGLSHGTDVWTNNAQDLIRKKVCTLKDAICTRDDIMLYLIKMGLQPSDAFGIMERVRKGRKLTPENEELMRGFKVPEWYIESCNRIQYMFPRAHAAAYVIMSLRVAYFKVYHPIEFYQTYFSVRDKGFDYEIMAMGREKAKATLKALTLYEKPQQKEKDLLTVLEVVNEMYARGIEFAPISIYKSHPTRFLSENGKILPALVSAPGLGAAAAEGIAKAREEGEFISIDDFKQRSGISKTMVEWFEKMDCLTGLPQSSQISLFDFASN